MGKDLLVLPSVPGEIEDSVGISRATRGMGHDYLEQPTGRKATACDKIVPSRMQRALMGRGYLNSAGSLACYGLIN